MHPRLSSLFVALLAVFASSAQVFPDDGSRWLYCYFPTLDPVPSYEGLKLEGDTLIESVEYIKLYHSSGTEGDFSYWGGVRTTNDSLVLFRPGLGSDLEDVWTESFSLSDPEQEFVLYDYSQREVGDTLWLQEVRYILLAEDQLEFGGELKRRLYWSRWDPVSQEDSEDMWVEGVGSTRRLFYPLYQVLYDLAAVNGELDCFLDQETVVLESGCPVQNPEDCFSLAIVEHEMADIRIYPNPAESLLYVDLSALTAEHRHATLVNTHGRIVTIHRVPQAEHFLRIDVSGIPSGVYLLILDSENGEIRKRVVVQ